MTADTYSSAIAKTPRLRLTPLEEYFYWEDRPSHPCCCFVRLRFSGRLDRDAFEAAWPVVLPRHPLLASRVVARRLRGLYWLPVDHPRPQIEWHEGEPRDEFPVAGHLDLHDEIGLRFHIIQGRDKADLVIQFHHACCDGIGMFDFVDELLLAYTAAVAGQAAASSLPPLDPGALATRGSFGLSLLDWLRLLPSQFVGLAGVRQFLGREPMPLRPNIENSCDQRPPCDYPATCCAYLDGEQWTVLRTAAKKAGTTVNDYLVRAMFLALRDWRREHGDEDDESWMRLMVPMNMRSNQQHRLSAANLVSAVFVDRRGDDCQDSERLLRSVQEEMDLIKRHELRHTFLLSLLFCKLLPGGLRPRVRDERCKVTCVLTNLGRLLEGGPWPRDNGRLVVGDAILENVDTLAPFRPQTHAALAVATYAGRMSLSLHYDSRAISADQAKELLASFLEAAHVTAEVGRDKGSPSAFASQVDVAPEGDRQIPMCPSPCPGNGIARERTG